MSRFLYRVDLATNTVIDCNAHGFYTAGSSSIFICYIMWGFLNSIVTSKGFYCFVFYVYLGLDVVLI